MNKASSALVGIILGSLLGACAAVPDSPPPLVDTKLMPAEKLVAYEADAKECRTIQAKAMPVSLFDALSQSDVHAWERRREDKAATIMRECLKGRGYSVLY